MGCGCKSEKVSDENSEFLEETKTTTIVNIIGNIILWAISIPLTVLIIPVAWIMLFNTLVLGKATNILPQMTWLGKMFKGENQDDDDDDDDEYESLDDINPDDYVLDNVDVIK